MESIKVVKVTPRRDMILLVEFNNGVKKEYHVGSLFNRFPEYSILRHKSVFDTAYVDCGGNSVAWTPDIDISEWELWDNGTTV